MSTNLQQDTRNKHRVQLGNLKNSSAALPSQCNNNRRTHNELLPGTQFPNSQFNLFRKLHAQHINI